MSQVIPNSQASWLCGPPLAAPSQPRPARPFWWQPAQFLCLLPGLRNAGPALLSLLATGLLAACNHATIAEGISATTQVAAGPGDTTKTTRVLIYGKHQLLDAANLDIYAYTRTLGADKALVVLNFSPEAHEWVLPTGVQASGPPWLTNYAADFTTGPTFKLRPWQAVVVPVR